MSIDTYTVVVVVVVVLPLTRISKPVVTGGQALPGKHKATPKKVGVQGTRMTCV